MLPMPETVFVRAADIYRKLRKKGITIRKSNDCIIAVYCTTTGTSRPLQNASP